MAEENSKKGTSSLLNLNSLLALFTLVAGFWLVSQRLSSSRPVSYAGDAAALGEQTLSARLWEDPFKPDPTATEKKLLPPSVINELLKQITDRRLNGINDILILPVMLPGGQYSEDRESRIRARYAINSGLGRMGYVHEDADHVGSISVPWPTTAQMRQVRLSDEKFDRLWPTSD
ncbi:MAG TPA: hypothetical protein VFJ90_15705, partial [Candidatus Didemnitutus sp.]|nr:hypothetical protein [Candidatus Didemnitutus sp.]